MNARVPVGFRHVWNQRNLNRHGDMRDVRELAA